MKRVTKDQYKGWRLYDYYEWLIEKVNCPKAENYTMLLRDLHDIPFSWSVPMDRNRALDGIELRKRYLDDVNASPYRYSEVELMEFPCSFLEMMIAMAERFCLDVVGEHFKNTKEYFWLMIENLGLNDSTDDNYDPEYVRQHVDNMIFRKYSYSGSGGLFPLESPTRDQRKVDLWYQLCEWFEERYGRI